METIKGLIQPSYALICVIHKEVRVMSQPVNRLGWNPCGMPPMPKVGIESLGDYGKYLVSLMKRDPQYTDEDVELLTARLNILGW